MPVFERSQEMADSKYKTQLNWFIRMLARHQKASDMRDEDIAKVLNKPLAYLLELKAGKQAPTFEDVMKISYAIGVEPVVNYWQEEDLENTNVKIKKLSENAVIPTAKRSGDAGYDLYIAHDLILEPHSSDMARTDVGVELPSYTVGQVWPRSGLSVDHSIETGAGIIDSNYRGSINVKLYNHSGVRYMIAKGDRIAQLLIIPKLTVNFTESAELSESERNDAGFGSSGK